MQTRSRHAFRMAKMTLSARDQDVHVVKHAGDGIWQVKYRGIVKAERMTQAAARVVGRELAIEKRCDLVVHDRHGVIKRKDSYGTDPRRRKG